MKALTWSVVLVGMAFAAGCGGGDDDSVPREWDNDPAMSSDQNKPDEKNDQNKQGTQNQQTEQPTCTPKTCDGLPAGNHDDGCGSTLTCAGPPCTDAKAGNTKKETAADLGAMTDTPASTRVVANLTVSDTTEDWFKVTVSDEGFTGNPLIRATTSEPFLISVYYSCNSAPDYSACEGGGAADNQIGKGCRNTKTVSLRADCDGFTEDGTAYVRVRKAAANNQCTTYTLNIDVE